MLLSEQSARDIAKNHPLLPIVEDASLLSVLAGTAYAPKATCVLLFQEAPFLFPHSVLSLADEECVVKGLASRG
jgi:predicted ATPase with chaperone activity